MQNYQFGNNVKLIMDWNFTAESPVTASGKEVRVNPNKMKLNTDYNIQVGNVEYILRKVNERSVKFSPVSY